MYSSTIIATGSYLPEKIVTNEDLTKIIDTSDEWIFERTGIKERRIVENITTSEMAAEAGKKIIEKANISPNDIDMIIVATTTPDLTFPSTACLVQHKLGINNDTACFDIQAVCSGFIYGLSIADDQIKLGKAKNILLIGAERMSNIVNWKDRNSAILFGDGAGGILLQRREENYPNKIIATKIHARGSLHNILATNGGAGSNKLIGQIYMNGREVFKLAVEKFSEMIIDLLKISNFTLDDVDLIIPHQANARIIEAVAKRLSIDRNKFILTLEKHANSSAASIILALDTYLEEKRKNNQPQDGKLVISCAVGGGMTWGGAILRL